MNIKRIVLVVGALIALATGQASAQRLTVPAPPKIRDFVDPNASALVAKAARVYGAAQGIRYSIAQDWKWRAATGETESKKDSLVQIAWQRPNRLKLTGAPGADSVRVVQGEDLWKGTAKGAFFRKKLSDSPRTGWQPNYQASVLAQLYESPLSTWMEELLQGQNSAAKPLADEKDWREIAYLPARSVEGALLEAVRTRLWNDYSEGHIAFSETTAWFDVETHLLRREQYRAENVSANQIYITRVTSVEIDPQFADGEFDFPVESSRDLSVVPGKVFWNPALKAGSLAPEIIGKGSQGRPFSLAEAKGHPAVICFWASWHDPAFDVNNGIEELVDDLQSLSNGIADMHYLGVLIDTERSSFEDSIDKATFSTTLEPFDGHNLSGPNARRWGITALPLVAVIGRDGRIVSIGSGSDYEGMKQAIRQAARKNGPATKQNRGN